MVDIIIIFIRSINAESILAVNKLCPKCPKPLKLNNENIRMDEELPLAFYKLEKHSSGQLNIVTLYF